MITGFSFRAKGLCTNSTPSAMIPPTADKIGNGSISRIRFDTVIVVCFIQCALFKFVKVSVPSALSLRLLTLWK